MFVSLALLLLLVPLSGDSLSADTATSRLQEAVTRYTRPFDPDWNLAEMQIAWIDLDVDGQQDALVYLHGAAWCGSGGCTLLVFAAVDSSDVEELGYYTPTAEISLMHGPVTVSPNQTQGWRDLLVQGSEGGWRRLSFDGETYPFSPSSGVALESVPDGGVRFFEPRDEERVHGSPLAVEASE